jgi:hypothetical protein
MTGTDAAATMTWLRSLQLSLSFRLFADDGMIRPLSHWTATRRPHSSLTLSLSSPLFSSPTSPFTSSSSLSLSRSHSLSLFPSPHYVLVGQCTKSGVVGLENQRELSSVRPLPPPQLPPPLLTVVCVAAAAAAVRALHCTKRELSGRSVRYRQFSSDSEL